MSKFRMGDVARRVLPSGTKVGPPMIVRGRICGKDLIVCIDCVTHRAVMYPSSALSKEPARRLAITEEELTILKRLHGIGSFYHDLTKNYEDVFRKKPKYVTFYHCGSGERLVYHLAKAEKVIKTIGISYNANYQPSRITCPMIKLTFIGELT